jgi:5-methylcytosine-specific restriction enzyme A
MRNPNWTRDELIVALDLYFKVNPLNTSETNPEIVAVSDLLNKLPIHSSRSDAGTFRNPNGVYMKLCNFLRLDPSYKGEGLKAGSRLDAEVWEQFAADRQRLQHVATAIGKAATGSAPELQEQDDVDEDETAPEGRILTRIHKCRERNAELVRRKKESVMRKDGCLLCEICSFDFFKQYGTAGEGFIECHHVTPLSRIMPGQKTRLEDLALVCANCHRMLHRGSPWPSLHEVRQRVTFRFNSVS